MRPISIFYHCVLNGPHIPSEDYAICVLQQQMSALKQSGLEDSASEVHVGINDYSGSSPLRCAFALPKSKLSIHANAKSEIPTMKMLQCWLKPGWNVLYFHTKGVSHPNEAFYEAWRQRMEHACVWNWRQCVSDLARGFDAVGCHWLTPEK